ncbi:MAG: hypothetical protein SFW66_06620 [Gammaproteobacteria bacterium]|nr:hypothetical protein [Gammaproteobacteria bacterium]
MKVLEKLRKQLLALQTKEKETRKKIRAVLREHKHRSLHKRKKK